MTYKAKLMKDNKWLLYLVLGKTEWLVCHYRFLTKSEAITHSKTLQD